MSGIAWAAVAGVGFGFFQVLNRMAGRRIDAYRGTFLLLAISSFVLGLASLATEDLSMLWDAPLIAFANFAIAGFIHFFLGWSFLTLSQHRVGAARTGALIGATPLFATAIAAITLNELLDLPTLLGIVLVVSGVYLISNG